MILLPERYVSDPVFLERVANGEPVLSKTVEIHPSKGTCAYSCVMCLWSDKRRFTYRVKGLTGSGLLTLEDWIRLLHDLRSGGVTNLVLSGGGEVLLNPDLPRIIETALGLDFWVQMYTSGFNLDTAESDLWNELVSLHQIRFSIHSPLSRTYDAITGLPSRLQALTRVVRHIKRLSDLRDKCATRLRIGIGFVIQALNFDEVEMMAQFAANIPVDFLNIRKDEVDVSDELTPDQLRVVRDQIVSVRAKSLDGQYPPTAIDFSDELVSLANGQPIVRTRSVECLAKYFRPTISPFGIVAPCDLKAEPRFASTDFNLGTATEAPINEIVAKFAERFIPDACGQCMPSSRTGNAVYAKLIRDYGDGILPTEQPFYFV